MYALMYQPVVDDYLRFRLYTNRFDVITHGNIHFTIYNVIASWRKTKKSRSGRKTVIFVGP